MIPFPLSFVTETVGGTYYGNPAFLSCLVRDVTIDSRKAAEGSLYVPVIGQVYDGHQFIINSFEKGALCTLSDRMHDIDRPCILVENTTAALQMLSEKYLERNRVKVVGITGSVGKTSTKDMIYSVLSQDFPTYHTPGNLNNQTGVPQAVFQIEKTHDVAVLELGTNHPGEIRALAKIVKPDICVFTNIGVAHIEFFGSREGIFRGKTEMLEYMQRDGKVIANGDDNLLKTIPEAILFGMNSTNAFRAENIEDLGLHGMRFDLCHEGIRQKMHVPSPGIASVYNALAAAACGMILGMSIRHIQSGIESYHPTNGRMDIQKTDFLTIVDDSYNANPDSVKSAVNVLKITEGRRIIVLGDMYELGENSAAFHYETGKYAAEAELDLLCFVGDLAKQMYIGANTIKTDNIYYFESKQELHRFLSKQLKSGDTVLVKASRGMHLEETVDFLKHDLRS